MPDVPDNVPIYIASDYDDSEPPEGEDGKSEKQTADKSDLRQSIMNDRSANNWQPYTKDIVDKPEEKKKEGEKSSLQGKLVTSEIGVKKRTVKFLLGVTALNMLAFGVYIGNRVIPRAPYSSSIDPAIFAESSKKFDGAIPQIVAKTNPCVVTIDVRMAPKTVPELSQAGNYQNPSVEVMPYQATGLIVRSDGYILTSAHALKKYDSLDVTLYDNKRFDAKLVGKDDFTDLAVIKIEATGLPILKFGDIKKLAPGDPVIAVGCPVGLDHTVTTGVVSSAHRSIAEVNNNRVEMIQHDALLYIGSSGGPLLNASGDVVGVNAAVRGGTPGMSFSVPSDVAADVCARLIADGAIPRPYMGLVMEDVDPNMTRSLTLPSNSIAVKVARVEHGGPGEDAGLQDNDLIIKLKGKPVKSSREVRAMTREDRPDQVLDLVILREGKEMPIKLKLGDFAKFRPEG